MARCPGKPEIDRGSSGAITSATATGVQAQQGAGAEPGRDRRPAWYFAEYGQKSSAGSIKKYPRPFGALRRPVYCRSRRARLKKFLKGIVPRSFSILCL